MKRFSVLFAAVRATVFCYIIFVTHLSGHGFDLATDVMFFQGGQELIFRLHEDADNLPQPLMSYDLKTKRVVKSTIQSAGVSEANCYVELGFDDPNKADIQCTPIQQFYVPAKKQWVPAYKLKIGDQLLSRGKNLKAITCVRFVKKKLRVYALWMKKTHNYMVGKYGVLTHNMVLTTKKRHDEKLKTPNQEAEEIARGLGYKPDKNPPFYSHGQKTFNKGNRWISRDIDSHNGGYWKLFDGKRRDGTYNKDLTKKIGD